MGYLERKWKEIDSSGVFAYWFLEEGHATNYEAIEEIKLAIEGMLDTIKEENVLGTIEVREVFKISKVGTVAGCYVTEGKVTRNSELRLLRDLVVVFQANEIAALREIIKKYPTSDEADTAEQQLGEMGIPPALPEPSPLDF